MYKAIVKDGHFPGDKIKKEMVKYITMPGTYKREKLKAI
jgi:hypothetical protein